MALDYIENFQDWSTANIAQEVLSSLNPGLMSIVDGPRAGSKALLIGTNVGTYFQCDLPSSGSTKFFCIRIYVTNNTSANAFLKLTEGATYHLTFMINSSAQIEVRRGGYSGTVLGNSGGATVPTGTWVQLTVKAVIHDTAGSVEVRMNGNPTPIINLSSVDTRNGGTGVINRLYAGSETGAGSNGTRFTDMAVWNDSGESPNDWVGDVRVDSYNVTADGASSQFTPSAGANWECVADENADGDTSYVESGTNGHIDLYEIENMAHSPSVIHAVAVTALARKTDAGSGALKLKMDSGGTGAAGSSETLADGSYARYIYARGVDPNTSAAWAKSAVDALKIGVEAVI